MAHCLLKFISQSTRYNYCRKRAILEEGITKKRKNKNNGPEEKEIFSLFVRREICTCGLRI